MQCQRRGLELESTPPPSWEEGVTKDGLRSVGEQGRALAMLGLMNGALWQVISANDADWINILQVNLRLFLNFWMDQLHSFSPLLHPLQIFTSPVEFALKLPGVMGWAGMHHSVVVLLLRSSCGCEM